MSTGSGRTWCYKHPDQREPCATCLENSREGEADRDLRAAKERLGAWLAAESFRSHWISAPMPSSPDWDCYLGDSGRDGFESDFQGTGPTEAAAILAALEKVNG